MIKIEPFKVPSNIKYFSDSGYKLPTTRRIIDKKIPGCGFTEFCLRSTDNIILCVPRVALLKNKVEQAFKRGEKRLMYICGSEVVTDEENIVTVKKKELDKKVLSDIRDHFTEIMTNPGKYGPGCKYVTTYDSFRFIRESLGESVIRTFNVVVDEFQIILKDSGFKSDTEQEFLQSLEGLEKVCFISATPIPETIVDEMPGFKDVEYEEFEWPKEDLIKKDFKVVTRPIEYVKREINRYLIGDFENFAIDEYRVIQSKELVIYVNSVRVICSIIKSCGLTYENTSVLCSESNSKNIDRLRKAFKLRKKVDGDAFENPFGEVPDGIHNKMFTFCTSAVYSGVDFYSDNARSIVMSCASSESLRDDPVIDIKQIAGRQRWSSNPWKNSLKIFTSLTKIDEETERTLKAKVQGKIDTTKRKLEKWESFNDIDKLDWLSSIRADIMVNRYSKDYVSVNKHDTEFPVVQFNDMVMLYDLYSLHILLNVYKDEYTYAPVENSNPNVNSEEISNFSKLSTFPEKISYLCDHQGIINMVDYNYSNYFKILDIDRIKACQFRKDLLDIECAKLFNFRNSSSKLGEKIYENFKEGERYSKDYIKKTISAIYTDLGISDTPKAVNITKWFDVKDCKVYDGDKRVPGFELVKKRI